MSALGPRSIRGARGIASNNDPFAGPRAPRIHGDEADSRQCGRHRARQRVGRDRHLHGRARRGLTGAADLVERGDQADGQALQGRPPVQMPRGVGLHSAPSSASWRATSAS